MSRTLGQLTVTAPAPRPVTAKPAQRLPLHVLGAESDSHSERGVSCPGDLPSPSDPALVRRAERARDDVGDREFILGHHYQGDEVIGCAEVTVDSFKLARDVAARPAAEYVVFCGVHFM